jgi:DNA ligase-1
MSRDGRPDVNYHVFDRHDLNAITWEARYQSLRDHSPGVLVVPHIFIHNLYDIEEYEHLHLAQGYEGVMLRDPNGPYKNGRSTAKEGWLLKVKRFEDSEALVLGMEEKMHNGNEATVGELGQTKRTSHQGNLLPTDTMGALIVRDIKTGVEFNIGTGFTDEERTWWWKFFSNQTKDFKMNNGAWCKMTMYPCEVVKYKYFAQGSKDKPRFPAYLGLRHKEDM